MFFYSFNPLAHTMLWAPAPLLRHRPVYHYHDTCDGLSWFWFLLFLGALFPNAMLCFAKTLVAISFWSAVGCGIAKLIACSSSSCCGSACAPRSACPCPTRRRKKCSTSCSTDKKSEKSEATAPETSTKKAYTFTIAAPGVKQADLSVEVQGRWLCVAGTTRLDDDRVFAVDKIVELPQDAVLDEATSTHEDGMLHFSVPRRTLPAASGQCPWTRMAACAQVACSKTDVQKVHKEKVEKEPVMAKTVSGPSAVLEACEPDAANVQVPEEVSEEVPTMETPTDDERDTEAEAEDAAELVAEPDDEWEEMLEELLQMGFDDREANRVALTKHGGSLRLAIKELVHQVARGK